MTPMNIITRLLVTASVCLAVFLVGCSSQPPTPSNPEITAPELQTMQRFGLKPLF